MKYLAMALALGLAATSAQASTISSTVDITASGPGSVGYMSFSVTTSGRFDIYTMGPTIDPQIFLFNTTDIADLATAPRIAANNNGCPTSLCGPAGFADNALIRRVLDVGNYILAVSDFRLTESEARSGLNRNDLTGRVGLFVSSAAHNNVGVAQLTDTSPVPLPAGFPLLMAGLAGLGFVARRKRKA